MPRPRHQASAPLASPSSPWLPRALALALIIVTVGIYAQVAHHDFVDFDDGLYVADNANVAGGLTAAGVRWAMTTGHAANWHPVTWLSHMLDVELFGKSPGPQHVVSAALHLVNALVLFALLHRMTGALGPSAWVAALFAVHPAHVESVAWIAERKDVLSTLFWLLTMWTYVSYVRRPHAARYAAMLLLFALGLMSKPMLVTLPFVLLLVDRWPLGRAAVGWRRLIVEKAPLFVLAAASSVVTFIVQQRGGAVNGLDVVPLGDRVANALTASAGYLAHLVWPTRLVVFYPYPRAIAMWHIASALILLTLLSAFVIRHRRTQPYLALGWWWFVGTMAPVIGLVQVGTQAMADRYTYVPYIGLFVAIAWGATALGTRLRLPPRGLQVAAASVVLALAAVAHAQAAHWKDSVALWQHAVEVRPDNPRAHNSLGALLGNQGRTAEAAAHFTEALMLKPDSVDAFNVRKNLGRSLLSLGRIDEALPHFAEAIRLEPGRADLHHEFALALLGKGRTDEAMRAWTEATRLDPTLEPAHFYLGMALASVGRFDEARRSFRESVRLNPANQAARQALATLDRRR